MHPLVFHNDRILPLEEVRLSPGQAGLLSGWGLFTTLRIYDGHPFAFERHWRRLVTDASRVQLPLTFDPESVKKELLALVRANQVKKGVVRVYFLFNRVGYWCSKETFPTVDWIMYTADLPPREAIARLALMEHGRYSASPLSGTKVTSWLNNVWSFQQAQNRGFDEVILLNERYEVAECTSANVYCVRGGKALTPPLSSGCLAGVTRAILLEIAGSVGVRMEEAILTREDLWAADEIFLSSTTREVCAVKEIEAHKMRVVEGEITLRLKKAFSDYIAEEIARCARMEQTQKTRT
jgi:branched-chain amino acid aminotransferase